MTLSWASTDEWAPHRTDPYVASTATEHRRSIPELDIDVTRTGAGSSPNVTIAAEEQGVVMTSTVLGFPVIARTTVPADRIAVARIGSAPRGSRWCGLDLASNTTLLYGPGADHTAISPEGLSFQIATLPIDRVHRAAEMQGLEVRLPAENTVTMMRQDQQVNLVSDVMFGYGSPIHHKGFRTGSGDATASAVARTLASVHSAGSRSVDSKEVVRVCVEYADIVYGMPSIEDLCLVAHLSERRLRQAFVETVGHPPKRYLLTRQLSQIRDTLEVVDTQATTVTRVALEAGVTHLSRFAQRYRELFEELPSETLARQAIPPSAQSRSPRFSPIAATRPRVAVV